MSKSIKTKLIYKISLLIIISVLTITLISNESKSQNESDTILCPMISISKADHKKNITNNIANSALLNNITLEITDTIDNHRKTQLNQTIQKDLQDLLTTRKSVFLNMLNENATQVIPSIINIEDQKQLDPITENCVEQQKTIHGEIEITHIDSFERNSSTEYYEIATTNKNETINLYPTDNLPNNLKSGMNVSAPGFILDNNLVFNSDFLRPDNNYKEYETLFNSTQITVNENQSNLAVIFINFTDTVSSSSHKDRIKNITLEELDRFYKINSGNRVSLSGEVFGPYRVPFIEDTNKHCPLTNEPAKSKHLNQVLSAADNDIFYPDFDRVIIIGPYSGGFCNGNDGWTSDEGIERPRNTPDGQANISVSYIKSSSIKDNLTALRFLGHELGHTFGLGHASSLDCKRSIFPLNPNDYSSGCEFSEYGDRYDIMGIFGHLNGPHLEYLGWLNHSNIAPIVNVTANPQSFILKPIEEVTSELKLLKINRGPNDFLYIEYRQPINFNSTIGSTSSDIFNGATFHLVLPGKKAGQTFLIDTSPDNSAGSNMTTVTTLPNNTLKDPISNTNFKVISSNPSSIRVEAFK